MDSSGFKTLPVDRRDWPECWNCNETVQDFRAVQTPSNLVFIAFCHGEEERSELPIDDVILLGPENFRIEEAFKPQMLR